MMTVEKKTDKPYLIYLIYLIGDGQWAEIYPLSILYIDVNKTVVCLDKRLKNNMIHPIQMSSSLNSRGLKRKLNVKLDLNV